MMVHSIPCWRCGLLAACYSNFVLLRVDLSPGGLPAGLFFTCCGAALLSMLSIWPSLPYTELTPRLITGLLRIQQLFYVGSSPHLPALLSSTVQALSFEPFLLYFSFSRKTICDSDSDSGEVEFYSSPNWQHLMNKAPAQLFVSFNTLQTVQEVTTFKMHKL